MSALLHIAVGLALAAAAWLIPRRVAAARVTGLAGAPPRSVPGVAGGRPAADRDRAAGFRRRCAARSRRRLRARRPDQARGAARAGRFLRDVRAAASLHPSAALPALRRAGAGARRGRRCGRARDRVAVFRTGAVGASSPAGRARAGGSMGGWPGNVARAGAGRAGGEPAAPRSDRRALCRRREARPVRDPDRLRRHRPGRARRAPRPPRRAASAAAQARYSRGATGPGAVRIVLRRAPDFAARAGRPAVGL